MAERIAHQDIMCLAAVEFSRGLVGVTPENRGPMAVHTRGVRQCAELRRRLFVQAGSSS